MKSAERRGTGLRSMRGNPRRVQRRVHKGCCPQNASGFTDVHQDAGIATKQGLCYPASFFYSAGLTKHTRAQKACHHTSISGPCQPLLAPATASVHASVYFCACLHVCVPASCVSEAVRTL